MNPISMVFSLMGAVLKVAMELTKFTVEVLPKTLIKGTSEAHKALKDTGAFDKKPKIEHVHGSAHFADMKETSAEGLVGGEGIVLGKYEGRLLTQSEPLHVGMFSATGGGKTLAVVIPSIFMCTFRHKIIVDPKAGEVERITGNYLRMQGNLVRTIRLHDPRTSAKYDPLLPLKRADKYSYAAECAMLAQLILPDAIDSKNDAASHFKGIAQKVMEAAFYYHVLHKPEMTLPQILRSLTSFQNEEKMKAAFNKWIMATGSPTVENALRAFMNAGERERGSFGTTLANHVESFISETAEDLFSGDDVDFRAILTDRTPNTVFIQYPIHKTKVYAPLARLLVGQALDTVMDYNHETGMPLKKPLTVIVDEAASLGYCEPLAKSVTYLRGANANLLAIFQNPAQIRSTYPDPDTFLHGFETWIVGKVDKDIKFAKEVSDIVGDMTIEETTYGKGGSGKTENVSRRARKLIKPEEIRQMGNDELLVISGRVTVKAEKAYWDNESEFKAYVQKANDWAGMKERDLSKARRTKMTEI